MVNPQLPLDSARYEQLTTLPQEVVEDILLAAHQAYTAVVESSGGQARGLRYDDVKSSPSCLTVANHITENLDQGNTGYGATTMGTTFPPRGTVHFLSRLAVPDVTPEPIVVDATWQQFLPMRPWRQRLVDGFRGEPLPVLIGTPRELGGLALRLGFSPEQAAVWELTDV